MFKKKSASYKETLKIAEDFSKLLKGNEVVAFFGDLGAGKTAFVNGIAKGLLSKSDVSSPTFAIMNEYIGKYKINHFDMYRVTTWDDLETTGFYDALGDGITVIEWSENIENALPENTVFITIEKGQGENERFFTFEGIDEF